MATLMDWSEFFSFDEILQAPDLGPKLAIAVDQNVELSSSLNTLGQSQTLPLPINEALSYGINAPIGPPVSRSSSLSEEINLFETAFTKKLNLSDGKLTAGDASGKLSPLSTLIEKHSERLNAFIARLSTPQLKKYPDAAIVKPPASLQARALLSPPLPTYMDRPRSSTLVPLKDLEQLSIKLNDDNAVAQQHVASRRPEMKINDKNPFAFDFYRACILNIPVFTLPFSLRSELGCTKKKLAHLQFKVDMNVIEALLIELDPFRLLRAMLAKVNTFRNGTLFNRPVFYMYANNTSMAASRQNIIEYFSIIARDFFTNIPSMPESLETQPAAYSALQHSYDDFYPYASFYYHNLSVPNSIPFTPYSNYLGPPNLRLPPQAHIGGMCLPLVIKSPTINQHSLFTHSNRLGCEIEDFELKRKRSREKNRQAAMKSRLKKRQELDDAMTCIDLLESRKVANDAFLESMKLKCDQLRSKINLHHHCPCLKSQEVVYNNTLYPFKS